jgi:hypothetical protein
MLVQSIFAGVRMRTYAFGALLLAVGNAGCGSTQTANEAARSKWLGRSADQFFATHGPPRRQHAMANGGQVYLWDSTAMPSGTGIQIFCSADIVTDRAGAIAEIRLKEDSIGHWNLSRCTELFN